MPIAKQKITKLFFKGKKSVVSKGKYSSILYTWVSKDYYPSILYSWVSKGKYSSILYTWVSKH